MRWLLAAAGPVTALPLLAFAAGARRIPFSMPGLLQYIAPTLQLLLGVWLYREPFEPGKALGFAAIWIALAPYSIDGHRTRAARAYAGAAGFRRPCVPPLRGACGSAAPARRAFP
jgi:chloramphenicol-sensitive protein RarD